MKSNFIPALFVSMSMFSGLLYADNIDFELPRLNGTGCPRGSHSISMSPDGKSISVLFDSFEASVPQNNGQNDNDLAEQDGSRRSKKNDPRMDFRVCKMAISANLPQGYKINSLDIDFDFRGFIFVEEGVVAAFRSILIQRKGLGINNGGRTELVKKRWSGYFEDDFYIKRVQSIPIRSRCVKSNQRRFKVVVKNIIGTHIKKNFPLDGRSGQISLDSADIVGKVRFKFNISQCNQPNPKKCRRGYRWNSRLKKCVKKPGHYNPTPTPKPHKCRIGQKWSPRLQKCVKKPGHYNPTPTPKPHKCPMGKKWSPRLQKCVKKFSPTPNPTPTPHKCPMGKKWNPRLQKCVRR